LRCCADAAGAGPGVAVCPLEKPPIPASKTQEMMQFLIMSHVAVADLNETETCTRVLVARCGIRKAEGLKDSAEKNLERARASPRHALEETPTIDAIVVVVLKNAVVVVLGHVFSSADGFRFGLHDGELAAFIPKRHRPRNILRGRE
jgi:hypothetical protein